MRDIQLVLERWGGWSVDNPGVGHSSIAAGFSGLLPPTSKSRLSCCDNDGLLVDAAVGKLKKVGRDDEFDLIEKHYVYGKSKSAIARDMRCSEGKIRMKMMIAETYIDACLEMAGIVLEMDDWTRRTVIKKIT